MLLDQDVFARAHEAVILNEVKDPVYAKDRDPSLRSG
jgi:hypothetical protein